MSSEDEKKKDTIEEVVDVTAEIFETASDNLETASDDDTKNDIAEETEEFEDIEVDTEELGEDDLFANLDQALMQQVQEELDADPAVEQPEEMTSEEKKEEQAQPADAEEVNPKAKKGRKALVIIGSIFLSLILLLVFGIGTQPGRKLGYWLIGKYIEHRTQPEQNEDVDLTPGADITLIPGGTGFPTLTPDYPDEPIPTEDPDDNQPVEIPDTSSVRKEDYVKNFLIFGLEQINGASNTDTMMIATINTKDKSVKLTSILRDMYVELEDGKGRKLNSIYARGRKDGQGPELLIATLEKYFKIDIEGYAYVNFSSFENIVDLLGGVTIELGKTEAEYLNTTNYISNEKYRNVKPGVNTLNGNQVVGYCRVRKVVTLGGATNDYGRTVRQRRVLSAIFEKYKSKNLFDLISITDKCISYVTTDLNANQIAELLEMLVENGITTMQTGRIPINDSFYDSGRSGYNGVTYGLVVDDLEANVKYLFQHLYADTEEEAAAEYEKLNK